MKFLSIALVFLLLSCNASKTNTQEVNSEAKKYADKITQENLKTLVYKLASDEFEGRKTGQSGQKIAATYIADFYKNATIEAAQKDGNYFQLIPESYFNGSSTADSENVIAYIKGSEKPDEYIVISAHYDHIGKEGEQIYNGADDDASGTSAIMEMARAFKAASDAGTTPKRSVVFLHVTGEEIGLYGSKYYTENPIFPLDGTVANINIDMIGRVDDEHKNDDEFVYIIGSDKISSELKKIINQSNDTSVKLDLDYRYDENDPNRYYYRSDHYNFAKNNIPVAFFFNGTHNDYHQPTDTPDKIRYDLLQKRTQLIFYTVWELANRDERIVIDAE